jgi:hypothetical protein
MSVQTTKFELLLPVEYVPHIAQPVSSTPQVSLEVAMAWPSGAHIHHFIPLNRGVFPMPSLSDFSTFHWPLTCILLPLLPVEYGSHIAQLFSLTPQVSLVAMAWPSGVHIHCFIPLNRGGFSMPSLSDVSTFHW